MAEVPNTLFRYDNFSGGEYGSLGGRHAPPNSFTATNMLVYADGSIGPRPGFKDVTPTSMPNGELLLLSSSRVPERDGIFIINTTGYRFDFGETTAATALTGSIAATPQQAVHPAIEDTSTLLFTSRISAATEDKTYRIDPTASTLAGISGSPGGHALCLRGQQLIVAESQFSPVIFASDPADKEDFSAGTFEPIGDDWQVTALYEQNNALVLVKIRGGWFVLHGVVGDADTQIIRRVAYTDTVLHPWQIAKDADEQLWFFDLNGNVATFNGTKIVPFPHLSIPVEEDATVATTPLKQGVQVVEGDQTRSTVAFVSAGETQQMLLFHNGIWTKHTFGKDVSGMMSASNSVLMLTDGGGASTPANIYGIQFDLDRPGMNSSAFGFSQPGDDSATPLTASLTLPEEWAKAGRSFQVKQVVVDFDKWDTGTSATAHFDVAVRVMGRTNGAAEVTHAHPSPYDEAVGAASAIPNAERAVFNFHCERGAGFEIQFTNIRNVSFHAIYVMVAPRDEEPVVR